MNVFQFVGWIIAGFIIVGFIIAASLKAEPAHFTDQHGGQGVIGILFAAGLLYVTYEGFGVVTNSAGDMAHPKKQLPRAMYQALGIVVLAYTVAKNGELPADFARGIWRSGTWGLLGAGFLTCLFVIFFPLASVGQMASLAFLIVYGAVSLGHLRVRTETGANPILLMAAVLLNLALFALLVYYSITSSPASTWITLIVVLVGSFIVEFGYRKVTGRKLRISAQSLAAEKAAAEKAAGAAGPAAGTV